MKLNCQKELFSLDPSVHYINCAYMAPLLKSSEEAGMNGILQKRNPFTVKANDFFDTLVSLRQALAELVHSKSPENIAIVASASYGLSTAAKNVRCSQGQEVVVVKDEFPSNYYIWERLCKEEGLHLKVISPDNVVATRAFDWNTKILEAINENTGVVAIENTHWMDGLLFDLKAISEKCKQFGTYLMVDGTQSVGMLDINVEELGVDALVCAGYKWLLGPYSTGFAYYSDRMLDGKPIEENWVNRKGSDQFAELTNYTDEYREGAIRYDVGETSNFILVPMFLKAVEQILAWGVTNMNDYVGSITSTIISEFREKGLITKEEEAFSPHLFTVNVPDTIDVKQLSELLASRKVYTSVRGTSLRISPNVYNTQEDLDLLRGLLLDAL